MTSVKIDRARRRRTRRHGGGYERVDLEECDLVAPQADYELLAVHDALDKLASEYPVQAEVVKLRYFGGRTNGIDDEPRLTRPHMTRTTVFRLWSGSLWRIQLLLMMWKNPIDPPP